MNKTTLAKLITLSSVAALCVGCSTQSTESTDTTEASDYELVSMKTERDTYNATASSSAVVSVDTAQTQSIDSSDNERRGANAKVNSEPFTPIEQVVYFEFDSSTLTEDAKQKLEEVIDNTKENADSNAVVTLRGFTDATGPEEYNKQLSLERAKSVKEFLAGKGVEARDFHLRALGERQPVASNDTRQGRAKNRRVSLTIELDDSIAVY